jgi:hypothetical protein
MRLFEIFTLWRSEHWFGRTFMILSFKIKKAECWKSVVGYLAARRYEVSNHGRVRGIVLDSWSRSKGVQILLQRALSNGYDVVTLRTKENIPRFAYVHTLVNTAFHGLRSSRRGVADVQGKQQALF